MKYDRTKIVSDFEEPQYSDENNKMTAGALVVVGLHVNGEIINSIIQMWPAFVATTRNLPADEENIHRER